MGNFQGRKLSEFQGFVVICESFLRKICRVASFSGTSEQSVKVFLQKSCLLLIRENFSHKSFPLYGIKFHFEMKLEIIFADSRV